jgi:tetratricopeptide (TPR) repeat protein
MRRCNNRCGRWAWSALAIGLLCAAAAAQERAATEGPDELMQAMELQISARSVRDLDECVSLCEQALSKGLDATDAELAHNIAASCLFQRASSIASVIIGRDQPHPRWPQLREIALNDLQRAVGHVRDLAEAQMMICKLQLLPGGDRERGLEAANEAIRLYADDKAQLAEAYLARSRFHEDPAEQLADMKRAREADPQNGEVRRLLAKVLFEQQQFEAAEAAIREMLSENEDAELRLALAETLANIDGKFDEAIKEIDRALQIDPKMAQAYTLRARLHTSHENLDAALADLGEALKINANDVGTILFRAELHLFRDDTKSAREDIEEALRQRPGLVLGILMRSRVNAAEKKFEDAIQDMELLVQNDPLNKLLGELIDNDKNNWRALRSRGDARLAIGEHAEAVEDYNQALAINPDDSGVLNNLAWVLATSPIDEVRDADRSLELATKACELTEYKQAHILSTLASSYAEKGDFESAIKWSSKAVELGEGDVKEQLEKELESYRAAKPWREKQETKEKPDLPKRNLLET